MYIIKELDYKMIRKVSLLFILILSLLSLSYSFKGCVYIINSSKLTSNFTLPSNNSIIIVNIGFNLTNESFIFYYLNPLVKNYINETNYFVINVVDVNSSIFNNFTIFINNLTSFLSNFTNKNLYLYENKIFYNTTYFNYYYGNLSENYNIIGFFIENISLVNFLKNYNSNITIVSRYNNIEELISTLIQLENLNISYSLMFINLDYQKFREVRDTSNYFLILSNNHYKYLYINNSNWLSECFIENYGDIIKIPIIKETYFYMPDQIIYYPIPMEYKNGRYYSYLFVILNDSNSITINLSNPTVYYMDTNTSTEKLLINSNTSQRVYINRLNLTYPLSIVNNNLTISSFYLFSDNLTINNSFVYISRLENFLNKEIYLNNSTLTIDLIDFENVSNFSLNLTKIFKLNNSSLNINYLYILGKNITVDFGDSNIKNSKIVDLDKIIKYLILKYEGNNITYLNLTLKQIFDYNYFLYDVLNATKIIILLNYSLIKDKINDYLELKNYYNISIGLIFDSINYSILNNISLVICDNNVDLYEIIKNNETLFYTPSIKEISFKILENESSFEKYFYYLIKNIKSNVNTNIVEFLNNLLLISPNSNCYALDSTINEQYLANYDDYCYNKYVLQIIYSNITLFDFTNIYTLTSSKNLFRVLSLIYNTSSKFLSSNEDVHKKVEEIELVFYPAINSNHTLFNLSILKFKNINLTLTNSLDLKIGNLEIINGNVTLDRSSIFGNLTLVNSTLRLLNLYNKTLKFSLKNSNAYISNINLTRIYLNEYKSSIIFEGLLDNIDILLENISYNFNPLKINSIIYNNLNIKCLSNVYRNNFIIFLNLTKVNYSLNNSIKIRFINCNFKNNDHLFLVDNCNFEKNFGNKFITGLNKDIVPPADLSTKTYTSNNKLITEYYLKSNLQNNQVCSSYFMYLGKVEKVLETQTKEETSSTTTSTSTVSYRIIEKELELEGRVYIIGDNYFKGKYRVYFYSTEKGKYTKVKVYIYDLINKIDKNKYNIEKIKIFINSNYLDDLECISNCKVERGIIYPKNYNDYVYFKIKKFISDLDYLDLKLKVYVEEKLGKYVSIVEEEKEIYNVTRNVSKINRTNLTNVFNKSITITPNETNKTIKSQETLKTLATSSKIIYVSIIGLLSISLIYLALYLKKYHTLFNLYENLSFKLEFYKKSIKYKFEGLISKLRNMFKK